MRRFRFVIVLLVLAWIPASGLAQVEQAPASREESVQFIVSDGVILKGRLILPAAPSPQGSFPLTILVHDFGRDRDPLTPLADALATRGLAALVLDMRGHGASKATKEGKFYLFEDRRTRSDFHDAVEDLSMVLKDLAAKTEVSLQRIGVLGIGLGALVAAEFSARAPETKALVLVDPVQTIPPFHPDRDLGLFDERPALLLVSAFSEPRERATLLSGYGSGPREIIKSESLEALDGMIQPGRPELDQVADWLAKQILAGTPPKAAP